MHKLFKILLLVCTLLVACLTNLTMVLAAPITGQVGVGTWNTQAEFADVKVVQGTTTLYQSNFASGASEWKILGGAWQTQNGYLRQTGNDTPATALVGSTTWSNYTLTLRARKISGNEGFLITFGSPGDGTRTWWNIGGWNNTLSGLQSPGIYAPSVPLTIQTGQWYDIKIELQDSYVRCYLNGVLVHDTNPQPITGMVGVGTWNTQAEFTDVKVVQGTTTLYQSNFAAGMPGWKTQGGAWQTTTGGTLKQINGDTPAVALVGDPAWSNYTLTLKARKNSGAEGFLITFGSPGDGTTTWWNIGGWGNTLSGLQSPGIYVSSTPLTIQTGQWYDIKIDVHANDIRCYLNGTLVHDTARILNGIERGDRFRDLLYSPGFNGINPAEQQWLNDLAGRDVYIGTAARATFAAMPSKTSFEALTASQQAAIIRKVNRNRLTWNTGWGYGSDLGRDATIIASMDSTVLLHNQLGLYDMQLTANNSPGTPTADASYGGNINFGPQDNFRVALHESSHALGTGTYWAWGDVMVNGQWTGFYTNDQLSQFDGVGSVLHGDTQHYWPYGLNYDNEFSDVNAYRHVLLVHALRRDMGIATLDVAGSTDVANGTYVLVPRNAPNSVLNVQNASGNAGTLLELRGFIGANSQKFLLDLQSDGTYRIRTALAGSRSVGLSSTSMDNGAKLQLQGDTADSSQRWFLIPTGDGWYRIAPKTNVYKGWDVNGGPNATADGTLVQGWDYLDGLNQQWRLTQPLNPAPEVTTLAPAKAIAGSGPITLTITGSGFVATSTVRWNGANRPTTFISTTQLKATLSAADLAAPAANAITVSSPTPGGGVSGSAPFTVAVPSLKYVRASVTRNGDTLTVTAILSNTGIIDVPAVNVTTAALTAEGKTVAGTGLPQSIGAIPVGGTGMVTLQFPGAGTARGTAVLRLSGTYAAIGTFSTAGAVPLPH